MEGELKLGMENRLLNIQEEWVKLEQNNIPKGEYVVTVFSQDLERTKIELSSNENVVDIIFEGLPVLLRTAIEGIRMRTWGEVQEKYQDKYYFRGCFFYEVKESKLIQWCIEEGCGFYEKNQLKHYCIVTCEEMIDIVASFDPIIKVK